MPRNLRRVAATLTRRGRQAGTPSSTSRYQPREPGIRGPFDRTQRRPPSRSPRQNDGKPSQDQHIARSAGQRRGRAAPARHLRQVQLKITGCRFPAYLGRPSISRPSTGLDNSSTKEKAKLYGKGKRYKVAGIPGVRARRFAKLTDAKQWLAHAQTDVTRQEFVDPREGTILLCSYVEDRWWPPQRYAATTRDAARRRIWGHVFPALGSLPLNAITAPALREWVARMEETLSPGTIRPTWGHLSRILQAAVEDGRLVKHPMKGSRTARPPAKPAQKARAWSREQAMRVRAGLPEQYRLAVDLRVGLGLRQGEAFGLSPEGLDAENGVVHVRRQAGVRSTATSSLRSPWAARREKWMRHPASWPASNSTRSAGSRSW
ncbi:site-specific integrase [Streptomyces sp. bgisy027]|uniref:site-specific integrase n=1 Tax=Streptomyces sp. bgisy027 TaxID=3413770 RepID=UPI003D73B70E